MTLMSEPIDREYWLDHCEGFRVDCAGGRIGFVEEVRSNADTTGKRTLAVRAGMLGRRRLLLPADEVSMIVPRAERIWLRSSPVIAGSEAPAGKHAAGEPAPATAR